MNSKKTKPVFDPHTPPPFPVPPVDTTPPIVQNQPMQDAQKKSELKVQIAYIITFVAIVASIASLAFAFGIMSTKRSSSTNLFTSSPSPSSSPSPTSTAIPSPTHAPNESISPTPTLTPTSQTKILGADPTLDGFQSSNGGGNVGVEIRAGRNNILNTRGFLSFDISKIPSGATVEKATLRIYQLSIVGFPYSALGNLYVDHINYGLTLENTDYGISSTENNFATLTTNSSIEWKDTDVAKQLSADLSANLTRSQYRIHFFQETPGGSQTGDFAYFESADNSIHSGKTPELLVRFH